MGIGIVIVYCVLIVVALLLFISNGTIILGLWLDVGGVVWLSLLCKEQNIIVRRFMDLGWTFLLAFFFPFT